MNAKLPGSPKARGQDLQSGDWYLVSNHLNLSYMIGAGMILPDSGFGEKYYADVLSLFPGNIVLFRNTIPPGAVDMAVREASYLVACIISVNLGTLTGSVTTITTAGDVRYGIDFPQGLCGDEDALVFPAPLPVSWVGTIFFRSRDDMAAFRQGAADFNNVDTKRFTTRVNKSLFKNAGAVKQQSMFTTPGPFPWPGAAAHIPEVAVDLGTATAMGGILAVIYSMADRSETHAAAFRSAFGLGALEAATDPELFINPFWPWLDEQQQVKQTSERLVHTMFWGTVKAIAAAVPGEDPRNYVLRFLTTVVDTWPGVADHEKTKCALTSLVHELSSLTAIPDTTLAELFDRHTRPFSRALILFFLKKSSRELLQFDYEQVSDVDTVAAAVLFGARDGWISLPADLRGAAPLQQSIVHRMAAMAHRMAGSCLDPGPAPEPSAIFRDLFKPRGDGWSAKQKKAALVLARYKQWDCVQTFIDLGHGHYTVEVTRSGLRIVLPGMEKGVVHDVDPDSFLSLLDRELSRHGIPEEVDADIRKILGAL